MKNCKNLILSKVAILDFEKFSILSNKFQILISQKNTCLKIHLYLSKQESYIVILYTSSKYTKLQSHKFIVDRATAEKWLDDDVTF